MIWGVCLLCLAGGLGVVHAGPLRNTRKMEDMAAPEEEIRVLMFGVLQFSESLSYVYDTTEAKVAKIWQTLRSHGETLQKLGRQTEEAAEVEKQMKEVIHLLQAQMVMQRAETKKTNSWLANVEQEEVELKTKVEKMEMHLKNSVPTNIKELQKRANEVTDILKGLHHLTEFHKENIETQNEKLSKLLQMSDTLV
ncbi:uncharacterized protein si:dkey-114l24.2 [Notolabrus celidotus]|uniref:uncharacterized protein si:dkey-114l24.2 n=1 Tax=Notolabrus celidotus TaxID=1203425 RepID=UPI00148F9A79|nr:uncharacterized protein si:dkey-114l24.2 [Notolabrus celidotus]